MDYILLIHKHLTGIITPEERALLYEWKSKSGKNQQLFEEIKQVWDLSEDYQKGDSTFDTEQELGMLLTRIDEEAVTPNASFLHRFSRNTFLKYAASLLLVASFVYLGYQFLTESKDHVKAVATLNSTQDFFLPDSTIVHLNKKSTLQFKEDFEHRTVQLSGEAYFNVTADRQNPFHIHTEYGTVQVVGTSFNVRALEKERRLVVVVETGIVKVMTKNDTANIFPGFRCIVDEKTGTAEESKNTDRNYLSWKTKQIRFHNARLENVFHDLGQHYDVDIQVDKHLLNCRFTGTFDNLALIDALEILQFSLGIKIQQPSERTVHVIGKHCK